MRDGLGTQMGVVPRCCVVDSCSRTGAGQPMCRPHLLSQKCSEPVAQLVVHPAQHENALGPRAVVQE